MNSSYFNMAVGALLAAVFVVMTISIASEAIYHAEAPEQPGFAIEVAEAEGGGEDAAPAEDETPFAVLLASADAGAGERGFAKCSACHSIEEGGANRVGPNLWDTVGRPIAGLEGFGYSSALEEFAQGGEVVWDYEHLDGFLEDPKGYIPGTAMSFAGIRDDEDRADMVAYLRSMSADPPPLPEAPAEGEQAAEGEETAAADTGASEDGTAEGDTAAAGAGDEPAAADSDAASEEPARDDAAAEESAQAGDDAAGDDATGDEAAGDGEQPAAEDEAAAGDEAATSDDEAAASDEAAAGDEAAADEDGAAAEGEGAAGASEFVSLVAAADPAVGERGFAQCRACHTVEEGGGNRVGPNLWEVVNRPVASVEGFNYSEALQEFAGGGEVVWDYEHLDGFLADPQGYVPGTLMGFAGIDDIEDRAAMVAYLRSLAGEPAPLPGAEQ